MTMTEAFRSGATMERLSCAIAVPACGLQKQRSKRIRLTAALVLAVGAQFVDGSAAAVIFAPLEPATCPALTYVNWQYDVLFSEQLVGRDDFGNPLNYANSVDNIVELTTNERVNEFWVRFDYFSTEPVYDYLQLYSYSPDGFGTNSYFSNIVPWQMGQPVWAAMKSAWHFPRANAFLRFHTDGNDNYPGVWLGQAAVCTRAPGAPLGNYARGGVQARRHTGVLLGTSDVVYFSFPNGSTRPGQSCDVAHDTFALQGEPGNDFDLYIRCGALPTPGTFDAADVFGQTTSPSGATANTGFLHAPTTCPCGQSWFVAVHSYGGSGWFNLWNHKHYASEHKSAINVYHYGDVPAYAISGEYVPELWKGMAHFFGVNEGTKFYDTLSFEDFNPTYGFPSSKDVFIYPQPGRPEADCHSNWYCGPIQDCRVHLFTTDTGYGTFEAAVLSHELGHYVNCLPDEYDDDDGYYCGHSMMAHSWGTQNNYCHCQFHSEFCPEGWGDHNRDGQSANGEGLWPVWESSSVGAPYTFTETPDNYDFADFDFHGVYANLAITDND